MDKNKSKYLMFVGIGFELIGIQFGLIAFGIWLAGVLNWPKVVMVAVGVILGLVIWLIHVIHALRNIPDKSSKEAPTEPRS